MSRIVSAILLCMALVLVSTSSYATIFQWRTEDGGNGHCFEPVLATVDWVSANSAAVAAGGYLATITSEAENDFVYSLVTDSTFWWGDGAGPWLGGFQPAGSPEPAEGWIWVTGETWGYTNWWPDGQPDNAGGNECYLHFEGGPINPRYGFGGYWNDLSPGVINMGYIIEYDACPWVPTEDSTWGFIKATYE